MAIARDDRDQCLSAFGRGETNPRSATKIRHCVLLESADLSAQRYIFGRERDSVGIIGAKPGNQRKARTVSACDFLIVRINARVRVAGINYTEAAVYPPTREWMQSEHSDAALDIGPVRIVSTLVGEIERGSAIISLPCAFALRQALLTTLNERLKSGDVTVTHSRRWTDFEDYLIPRVTWAKEREQHYAKLGLPLQGEQYLVQLRAQLAAVTAEVDRRVPGNSALSIDAQKGEFHLAGLKGADKPDEVKTLKELIESRLPRTELVDVLIDMDHRTDFLRHFLHYGAGESRLPAAERRRNSLAALIAIGCNIGPQRMAVASGLTVHEISEVADWYLSADALKAASIDLINYASRLPLSRVYGRGASCSADGVRFYVPVNLLAADYSHVLQGRGVTL